VIGILQGRLTRPWNGKLQCFPREGWEAEFDLARKCGLEAIELFVETGHNPDNPVWSEGGRKRLRELSRASGVATPTLCADCFMATPFHSEPERAVPILQTLIGFGFRRIVLPFYEKAELRSSQDVDRLCQALNGVDRKGVELELETSLPAVELIPLIDRLGAGVCYDLGNTTAFGHNLPGDIRLLGSRIGHVHVKDKRRADGQNVLLGTGDTDFRSAFAALREIGYAGDYTMETFRGDDPVETARKHAAFVQTFLR